MMIDKLIRQNGMQLKRKGIFMRKTKPNPKIVTITDEKQKKLARDISKQSKNGQRSLHGSVRGAIR